MAKHKPKIPVYPVFASPTFRMGEHEFPMTLLFDRTAFETKFSPVKVSHRRVKFAKERVIITQATPEIIALAAE